MAQLAPGLGQEAPGNPETVHRRRRAAVGRDMEKGFLDFFLRHAVANGCAQMDFQLVRPVQRGKHREVHESSRFQRQDATRPACAPPMLGDVVLQVEGEVIGFAERLVDVRGAEPAAPGAGIDLTDGR